MALTYVIDSSYNFEDLFRGHGRENSFSPNGYDALFNYLVELSNEIIYKKDDYSCTKPIDYEEAI